MSTQTSPDPELPFLRAWSLRPRLRRTGSSEIDISPKATPPLSKPNKQPKRPDHVRLPSGQFLDRIGLRDRSDRSQRTSEDDIVTPRLIGSAAVISEPVVAPPDVKIIPTNELSNSRGTARSVPKSAPSTPNQRKFTGWRTMLRLRANSKQTLTERRQHELSPPRSFTSQMLDRASTILKHLPDKKSTPLSPESSSRSTLDSSAHRSYLSPLRRIQSSSSSLRNILMGDVPLGTPMTPDSTLLYTGSDQKQYFRVEISAPGAPTYLPSEARRIGTPPLLEQNGKPRGLLFSYDLPNDKESAPRPESKERPAVRRKRSSGYDWYTAKLEADETRDTALGFELNVPEHLPNSPLCPRHPKNKSGGKGICIYHGRNREELGDT